jgi:hypothetical protein
LIDFIKAAGWMDDCERGVGTAQEREEQGKGAWDGIILAGWEPMTSEKRVIMGKGDETKDACHPTLYL